MGMSAGEAGDTLCERLETLLARAAALVDAVTFDDSGRHGQGGNGGLLSRETIGMADGLRLAIAGVRAAAHGTGSVAGRGDAGAGAEAASESGPAPGVGGAGGSTAGEANSGGSRDSREAQP